MPTERRVGLGTALRPERIVLRPAGAYSPRAFTCGGDELRVGLQPAGARAARCLAARLCLPCLLLEGRCSSAVRLCPCAAMRKAHKWADIRAVVLFASCVAGASSPAGAAPARSSACGVKLQELYTACSPGAPCVLGECGCGHRGWMALPKRMSCVAVFVLGGTAGLVRVWHTPYAAVVCSRQMEGPPPQYVLLFAAHNSSCSAAASMRGGIHCPQQHLWLLVDSFSARNPLWSCWRVCICSKTHVLLLACFVSAFACFRGVFPGCVGRHRWQGESNGPVQQCGGVLLFVRSQKSAVRGGSAGVLTGACALPVPEAPMQALAFGSALLGPANVLTSTPPAQRARA